MVHLTFFFFCLRFFPYGANGMLAGSATVFFAYIGFDSVASTAEEVWTDHISPINIHLFARSVPVLINGNSFILTTGEKSPTRSATGNRNSIVSLLFLIHVGFSCYRWSGTIFRYGPRYAHFICLCETWNAVGHVRTRSPFVYSHISNYL